MEFIGPNISNASGMKVCVFDSDWYFSSFRLAAPSAAPPADEDVVSRCDSARVPVNMTSQIMHFPACHGLCVIIITIIIIMNDDLYSAVCTKALQGRLVGSEVADKVIVSTVNDCR